MTPPPGFVLEEPPQQQPAQPRTRQPASVRHNNPGAMWYVGGWQDRYGAGFGQRLNDGLGQGNQIASFPDPVSGAAAQMELLSRYGAIPVRKAISKWSGGNNVGSYLSVLSQAGFSPDDDLGQIMSDKNSATRFGAAMAYHETGDDFPLDQLGWESAYDTFQTLSTLPAGFEILPSSSDPQQGTNPNGLPDGFEIDSIPENSPEPLLSPDPTAPATPDLPNPFMEFGARVARGAETETRGAASGAYDAVSRFLAPARNDEIGKSQGELENRRASLQSRIADEIEADARQSEGSPSTNPTLQGLQKQLRDVEDAIANRGESFAGSLSRSTEELSQGWAQSQQQAAEKYTPYISAARNTQWGMQLAEAIGGSVPGTAAALANPLFGLSVMYAQTYNGALQEFIESREQKGQPVNRDESSRYAHTQALLQTPWELAGEVKLAGAIKKAFDKLPPGAVEKGAQSFGKWLGGAVTGILESVAGEALITTPAQSLTQDYVAEAARVQAPTNFSDKVEKIPEQMALAAATAGVIGGGATITAAPFKAAEINAAKKKQPAQTFNDLSQLPDLQQPKTQEQAPTVPTADDQRFAPPPDTTENPVSDDATEQATFNQLLEEEISDLLGPDTDTEILNQEPIPEPDLETIGENPETAEPLESTAEPALDSPEPDPTIPEDAEVWSKPPVAITALPSPSITQEKLSDAQKEARRIVREKFQAAEPEGGILNKDTNARIKASGKGINHSIHLGEQHRPHLRQHIQAAEVIDKLWSEAIHVVDHAPSKGDLEKDPTMVRVHRFVAPLVLPDGLFRVKLTAKEYKGDSIKYYDQHLTQIEKLPAESDPDWQGFHTSRAESPTLREDQYGIPISQLLDGVKFSDLSSFSMADPDFSGNLRKRIAQKQKEGGSIDASILADILEYGRFIYRQGMEYLDFALQMVRDLGEGVRSVLRRVWKSLTGQQFLPHARQRAALAMPSGNERFAPPPQTAAEARAEEIAAPINEAPNPRLAIYQRAKSRITDLLLRSEQRIQQLTNIGTDTSHIEQSAEQRMESLRSLTNEKLAEIDAEERQAIQQWGDINLSKHMDRVESAKTPEARSAILREAHETGSKVTAEIRKRFNERRARERQTAALREKAILREARFRINQTDKAEIKRAEMLADIATLEALLRVLPPSVRARIGGFTKLASFKTPEARARYIDNRVKKIAKEIDKQLRGDYTRQLDKLFKQASPARNKAGKARKGKAGADLHAVFDLLKEAIFWDATTTEAQLKGLEASLASGELTPEQETRAQTLLNLIPLFSDWKNADSSRRAAAIEEGTLAWSGGYHAELIRRAEKSERRTEARKQMIQDAGGAHDIDNRKKRWVKRPEFFLSAWMKNLFSLEQILHTVFGEKNFTVNTMIDGERNAHAAYIDSSEKRFQRMDDLFTRLAGGSKIKGQQLQYRLMDSEIDAAGLQLSQMEAITALLFWRQEKGRKHMIGHLDENGHPIGEWHYGQEFIDSIERQLSQDARVVLEFLANEYGSEWESLNPTYREIFGIDMPREDSYSPLTVAPSSDSGAGMLDPISGQPVSQLGGTPGSLRQRGAHIAKPRFMPANEVFFAHVKQVEYWKAHAPLAREVQSLLGRRDLRDAIEANHGPEALRVIDKWREQIINGGFRASADGLAIARDLRKTSSRATRMALFGGIKTILINYTQLAASLSQMPAASYLKRMGGLFTGQLGWKDAIESPYIQRRLKEMPPAVRVAMEGLLSEKPTRRRALIEKIGGLINGSDALFTAGTYAIIYDFELKRARGKGLPDTEARARARQQAEKLTDRVAQPMRPGTRSIVENSATGPWMRALWAFASEARKNLAIMVYTLAKNRGSLSEKLRTIAAFGLLTGTMSVLLNTAWRDMADDDDDEIFDDKYWNPLKLLRDITLEPMYGIPVLGSEIQNAALRASGDNTHDGSLFSLPGRGVSAFKRLPQTLQGEQSTEDTIKDAEAMFAVMGMIPSSGGFWGRVADISADAKVLVRTAKDIYTRAKNLGESSPGKKIALAGKRWAAHTGKAYRGLGSERLAIQNALILGDKDAIMSILRDKATAAGGSNIARDMAIIQMRDTIRDISPLRIAAGNSRDIPSFSSWAKRNIPQEFSELQAAERSFQKTAAELKLIR